MNEVIVAGGGPAGLAAAIAARQAGLEVSLFDGARPPIYKACGEGIMPDGLAALQRLGVTIPLSQVCAFRGIRFVDDSHSVGAAFANGVGYGIRRLLLHERMMEHAAALGVHLNWGTRVTGISTDSIEVDGKRVPFRWLVCADGQNSPLRNKTGQFPAASVRVRYGFRRHYRVAPWTDYVEVHWADCGQMYVTPVATDRLCVAFITPDLRMRFDDALPRFTKLAARLAQAEIVGTTIGSVTASRRLRRVQSGRIALIGEAAGSVDAITGEGLSIAFQHAFELAAAMRANHLDLYQKAHERIMRVPRNMSRLLLSRTRGSDSGSACWERWSENMARSTVCWRFTPDRVRYVRSALRELCASDGSCWMPESAKRETMDLVNVAMRRSGLRIALLAVSLLALFAPAEAQQAQIKLDPVKTRVEWTLGDVLHTVQGTFQLKSGTILFDPQTGEASGQVVVDAASGNSGNGMRDSKMKKDVLESAHYPEILFSPKHVSGYVAGQESSTVQVAGSFAIHGRTHELTLTLPIVVKNTGVEAHTKFVVPYEEWGMKNPSTLFLKVEKTVQITISAVGELQAATAARSSN